MTPLSHRIRQVDPTKAALLCAITACFLAALIDTFHMKQGAALMPRFLSGAGLMLCLLGFLRFAFGKAPVEDLDSDMGEGTEIGPRLALRYGLWMAVFVTLMWLVGLAMSIVLFSSAFLWVERRATLLEHVAISGSALIIALPLGRLLNIHWPAGAVFSLF